MGCGGDAYDCHKDKTQYTEEKSSGSRQTVIVHSATSSRVLVKYFVNLNVLTAHFFASLNWGGKFLISQAESKKIPLDPPLQKGEAVELPGLIENLLGVLLTHESNGDF
jgi:hypothetical protein